MAVKIVSQNTSIVKENGSIRFHSIGNTPAVLSTEVARHFSKKAQPCAARNRPFALHLPEII